MPLPLRQALLDAVQAWLAAELASVTLSGRTQSVAVQRARRAPVDVNEEDLPLVVVHGGDMVADTETEPLNVHYQIAFDVAGYMDGDTDEEADNALSELHALVVTKLGGWTPGAAEFQEVQEADTQFQLYGPEECDRPAGEFVATFTCRCPAGYGSPYVAE